MKRFLSILLAALLIVSTVATVTFADATPTITVGSVEVKQGQSVDVYVTLSDCDPIAILALADIDYDDAALTLTNAELLMPDSGSVVYEISTSNAETTVVYSEDKECDGNLVKLTFAAAADAALGAQEVGFDTTSIQKYDGTQVVHNAVAGSITVVAEPFPDTIKLEDKTVTYNDEAQTIAVAGLEGDFAGIEPIYTYKNGDEVLASAPSTVGTYTVIAHIEKAGYTPKDLTATLTIEPKEVEIDGLTAVNKVYDKMVEVDLTGGELVGKIGNDDVTATIPTVGTVADANAGTAKAVTFTDITLTGADAANYVLAAQPTVTVDITKLAIAVKADDVVAVIGESIDSVMAKLGLSLTSGALVGTDTLDANPETGIFASAALDALEFTSTAAEGTYTITKNAEFALTETAAKNYDMTFADGTLTVQNKLAVNVTVSMAGWTYGGDASALTYEQTDAGNGTVAGEPTILFTGTTTAGEAYNSTDKPSAAGTYKVTVTYEDANLYGSDYADFEIAKADIDMSAVALEAAPYTFNYTDAEKAAAVDANTLPAGVTVKSISYKSGEAEAVATPVEVGTYAVIVAFNNADKNYNDPADKTFADALTINAEKPSNVVITVAEKSSTGTTLAVTITADANGSAITSYTVQLNSETPVEITEGNTYTFEGLTEGTEYTIKATATNGVDTSAEVSVTATPQKRKSSGGTSNGPKLPTSSETESVVGGNDTDKPGTEEPGTEEPGTEEPGTEEPGTEEPGTEEPEIEIVVDPDEDVAVINPAEAVEKDAETGAIVWENTYEDVKADEWYADAVGFAKTTGLMNGVGETSFAPEATLTRGMFATVLYRLVDAPEAAQKVGFKDVADDAWYADAINWGVKNGVINGVGGASFAPENEVTREQMATMIYRFANLLGYTADGAELAFDDAADVADYATEAFAWCTANGIINGVSDTELAPQETATRAQAAAVFMRAVEFFNK